MTGAPNLTVEWLDRGREPQCAPDPRFPNGKDIILAVAGPACSVDLPYPAKRCGVYIVRCAACGQSMVVTTAGRPDDPRSITLPCVRTGTMQ